MRIADRWFDRRRIDDDITLLWEPYVDPLLRCNIWHVRGRDRDLLVDTGMGICSLREAARDLFDKPLIAAATHTHQDHSGGMHEFAERLVHAREAESLAAASNELPLVASKFGPGIRAALEDAGYRIPDQLLTAHPRDGFDPAAHRLEPAAPTWIVEEGDRVDTGDRAFEILHLPGHSPGSIGLWEAATGTLFSGDAIYDGPLLDTIDGADIADYAVTMERLRALPVTVVHGGHDPSFGRARMIEIADQYLAKWAAA